jgi:hypothetical protein
MPVKFHANDRSQNDIPAHEWLLLADLSLLLPGCLQVCRESALPAECNSERPFVLLRWAMLST